MPTLTITALSDKGRGRGQLDGKTIEVYSAIPEDEVHCTLLPKRRASLLEITRPSPHRIPFRCAHAPSCGGCSFQQLSYRYQCAFKQKTVHAHFKNLIERDQPLLFPILPCSNPWQYRGKMEYTFAENKKGERSLGLHCGDHNRVFNLTECHLTVPWFSDAVAATRSWWQSTSLHAYFAPADLGSLITLTLRGSQRTHEKMAILTVSGNPSYALSREHLNGFVQALTPIDPAISLFLQVKQSCKGVATQFFEMHLAGPTHIHEEFLFQDRPIRLSLSPTSFSQPNTHQAELLYNRALEMTSLPPHATVYDLYCGTAAFGIAFSHSACHVIGIESNPYAIFDAQQNLAQNHITNMTLQTGDVGELLSTLARPDLVILDPPRSGLTPKAIQELLRLSPAQILYISCNPKTQAENITALTSYRLLSLQPIDQFPHTYHIENIALLRKQ